MPAAPAPRRPAAPRRPSAPRPSLGQRLRTAYAGPAAARLAFGLMLFAIVAVRFWNLDGLQSEVFGDISTATIYVRDVLSGTWPFYIPLSTGPLFHYLAAPAALLLGLNYLSLKISSVLISLAALGFTYLLARRLLGARFATLATFIAGISFWLLIHSRLGNVPIVVPLLAAALGWLLVSYQQQPQPRWLYWAAFVSILGLYTYPGAYLLPAALLACMLLWHFRTPRPSAALWLRVLALLFVLALPYVWIVSQNTVAFSSEGYLGGKFATSAQALWQLAQNAIKAFAAYNFKGDSISRVNIAGRPHLDALSGVLFLLGILFWLRQPRRTTGGVLLILFVMLHIPSMLVVANSQEVPSATRTLGAAPLAYLFVASGLWQLAAGWPRGWPLVWRHLALGALLAAISALNLVGYFGAYIHGLPYQNTPIARHITQLADLLPADTQVYLVGCCWEGSMPEPISIADEIARPENFHPLQAEALDCRALEASLQGPAVVFWSFHTPLPAPQLAACAERFPAQLYTSPAGLPMFYAATVQGLPIIVPVPNLESQWLHWEDALVLVRHSALDSGRIEDLFDGNFDSLLRGREANPLILDFEFDSARTLSAVQLSLAGLREFEVNLALTYADGSQHTQQAHYADLPSDPRVTLSLPPSQSPVSRVELAIRDLAPPPTNGYHIHVRELTLQP
ncbi:MAG: glycosyltransferase family 39 protein [Anaerolineales bacterium]|nr:glycosyltransferase family 39 protein [Anaerolineales bacterium]